MCIILVFRSILGIYSVIVVEDRVAFFQLPIPCLLSVTQNVSSLRMRGDTVMKASCTHVVRRHSPVAPRNKLICIF